MAMEISYDPVKRERTLAERGLDFEDAAKILDGRNVTNEDIRFDYPEMRLITFGLLDNRMVTLVWTPTENGIRVISLRKANEREQRSYKDRVD
jgi:uncharacterized DUF497 family protein